MTKKIIIALLMVLALSAVSASAMAACTSLNVYLNNNNSTKTMVLKLERSDDPDLKVFATVGPGQIGSVYDCATAMFLSETQYTYYAYVYYEGEQHTKGWAELITVNSYIIWPTWVSFWINRTDGVEAEASVNLLAYEGTLTIYAD